MFLVVVLVGFLVWVVFWVLLGWGDDLVLVHYVGVCWMGWDEDEAVHSGYGGSL